ncbi:MAG: hypothetical protein FJY86_01975 [Candidatus Diapherotrites archaeon]|uniref:Thioredoxin family protein n=1 Tax=Candidatus Iainarchaeum sp. TaxID=3101447 RepID=A0A8T4C824_9ARCH|nr:hypothetical protein [Candidatus Diapherotrites archaeon]
MVSPFIKAFILMVIILGTWISFSMVFEGQRNSSLLGEIDSVIQNESAVRSYLEYVHATQDEERYCFVLREHISSQNRKLFGLLDKLEQARVNSINNQYPLVRKQFQSVNAQLFFSLKRFEEECPEKEQPLVPVLYFFPDKHECAECRLQAQILTELGKTCQTPVQIFAFPVEGGIEIIDLLVKDYNISEVPSLVIYDKVHSRIQSSSQLNELLHCK